MRRGYRFCRLLCRLFFVFFFRGRVFHKQRVPLHCGVLLVCNHQSYLDPVLAGLALDRECHFMARDTLFANPWFRRLIVYLNAFAVRRGTADLTAIKDTLRRLKAGCLVTVFPEATRTRDGSVAPMQSGVVLLARKTGVPLVPTLIHGAFEAWPRHSPLPMPSSIIVEYAEPFHLSDHPDLTDDQCIAVIRERIVEMMEHYRGRDAKHPG